MCFLPYLLFFVTDVRPFYCNFDHGDFCNGWVSETILSENTWKIRSSNRARFTNFGKFGGRFASLNSVENVAYSELETPSIQLLPDKGIVKHLT
jgi:hypothetical protein